MQRFLVVIDTPGIKQFVFGTDAASEIRGGSAILDRLNRDETFDLLGRELDRQGARLHPVFANGGSAQAVVQAHDSDEVEAGLFALARRFREQTGGEVRIAWGLSAWNENEHYGVALDAAHAQMRRRRETAFVSRTIGLLPFVRECSSASHLPAARLITWGGERLLLSEASRLKRAESRTVRRVGPWEGWMRYLAGRHRPWPSEDHWEHLRSEDFAEIAGVGARRDYLGLVYADGNVMGRLVQELDAPETCAAFSTIVDSRIRDACHEALEEVCARDIAHVRRCEQDGKPIPSVPADILLLGGDDLLVVLPATRALAFVLLVTQLFEKKTIEAIERLPTVFRELTGHEASSEAVARAQRFFRERLLARNGTPRGLTVSCGVAIARPSYPFYLLLDLAEELLKSAKKGGSKSPEAGGSWAPAFADFHCVTTASGHELDVVRGDDYQVGVEGNSARTLRPYSLDRLEKLRAAVRLLHGVAFPRTKLNELFEASLEPMPGRAERLVRESFSHCREPQRRALWDALQMIEPGPWRFPWYGKNGDRFTAVADLAEAFDLFEGPTRE